MFAGRKVACRATTGFDTSHTHTPIVKFTESLQGEGIKHMRVNSWNVESKQFPRVPLKPANLSEKVGYAYIYIHIYIYTYIYIYISPSMWMFKRSNQFETIRRAWGNFLRSFQSFLGTESAHVINISCYPTHFDQDLNGSPRKRTYMRIHEILHHLETMKNHCSLAFTGESSETRVS